ncbi:MAG: hypothetical protein JWL81_2456, partial [Verrucomicrobiales bacterium]|nr:hypothetical protein [Verrucomicrobiales bacterium]
ERVRTLPLETVNEVALRYFGNVEPIISRVAPAEADGCAGKDKGLRTKRTKGT